ncbi:MAG: RNA-binding protein [Deltaproteobacteria bacterium]|nr:RNA-binding protein [Deltaproteobacteria bacterium]
MGIKLYVGSLPYSVNDQTLKELFAPFGTVDSAKVIMDRYSGQSKGFGFVEMADEQEGLAAIEKLNGSEYGGRNLTVSKARPQDARSGGKFSGSPGGKGKGPGDRDRGGPRGRW